MKECVYIIDSSVDITGAFICARNEAAILNDRYDFVLVLPRHSAVDEKELRGFKRVVRLPIVNIRKSVGSIIAYLPMLLISGYMLKKEMQKDGCGILQVNDFYMMQGVVAKLLGFKGAIHTWVRIDHRRYGSFLSKWWLEFSYRYGEKVVAMSKFIEDILPPSPKNTLIYDPYYTEKVHTRVFPNSQKVVYIANYIRGKGQQYAIDAFLRIAAKYPDASLHFYGGDMGLEKNRVYKHELEEQAKGSSQIHFHGFVKSVGEPLGDATVALNFSDSESFSMTVLEAQAHGVATVATASGGPQEIIVEGETGLLVEVGNVDAMSAALDRVLGDPELCRSMGERAMEHIAAQFSPAKFRENIIELFEGGKR